MTEDLVVSAALIVPGSELDWTAVRSSGPGGQNVNKVSTKVVLRFDPRSPCLPERVSTRLQQLARARLDAEGRIAVTCDETRSQVKNLALARERLCELIRAASVVPKRRKATRPSRAAKQARLAGKHHTAEKKKQRGGRSWSD
jgi:ribosome-associated protein